MIDPELHDWWSWKRLTELRCQDSLVNSAGISLKVILPIFLDIDLTWFSRIYGDYDDNLVLLAFDKATAGSLERVKHDAITPIQTVYDGDFHNEYRLTEKICSDLGMNFNGNDYSIERENAITYQVYIHDNCFFFIKPASGLVLQGVVKNVLSQHSYYLGQEVDWSKVTSDIVMALTGFGRIQLQSDPKRRCIWIPQLEDQMFLWKAFRPDTILIEDGEARFREDRVRSRLPSNTT